MEASWLNALVALATFLTLLLSLLIGYLFRLTREMSEYKIYVARNHATKEELKDLGERVERQIETGFTQMMNVLKQRDAA
ncbi:hypothetical protein [Aliivibrio kagoshimensis]|uniref:hypothetical protein n=1 Tax=Aliivibrio kagoshimensis TaxID=2910230 RepID=UPI003D13950B